MDIGTPERYLKGTFDIIEGNVKTAVQERLGTSWMAIEPSAEVLGRAIPPAVLESGVRVAAGAQVGSLVVLGATSRSARAAPSNAPLSFAAPRLAKAASCVTASSGPAAGSDPAARSPAERCSARTSAWGLTT